MSNVAFITGVTGQDGSYLTDLLLSKGYDVHGLIRQSTQFTPDKWGYLRDAMAHERFTTHFGDLTSASDMRSLIETIQPNEVYNLASQSHVGLSFEQPGNTSTVTALGPLFLLEAIRKSKIDCRFYQASSSEMFGKVKETPQSETTGFHPRSPYGCAKVYGHYITQNYREAYGMFAVNGILFNHESERRGENFVTRKITRAIGRIVAGTQDELVLGSLDARRDWGYSPDYVEAMWMMLQRDVPIDFVIGTGETHSVEDFLNVAFAVANLDPKKYVRQDPRFMRPAEVDTLCANPMLARVELKWEPTIRFKQLVKRMVEHDIYLAELEKRFINR